MKLISGGVCAAKGYKANGIHCGIRRNHSKKDLALIVSDRKYLNFCLRKRSQYACCHRFSGIC